jgi:hypothetical protein
LHETFKDHSTHSRKLFATVGNAELNKKVSSYTMDHKSSLTKPFNFLVVLVLLWRDSIAHVAQSRDTICQTVEQFEETGSVCDKCAKRSKRNASVRTEECVGVAQEATSRIQKQSLAQQIGASQSTVWNICCDDLSMFPTQCNLVSHCRKME